MAITVALRLRLGSTPGLRVILETATLRYGPNPIHDCPADQQREYSKELELSLVIARRGTGNEYPGRSRLVVGPYLLSS